MSEFTFDNLLRLLHLENKKFEPLAIYFQCLEPEDFDVITSEDLIDSVNPEHRLLMRLFTQRLCDYFDMCERFTKKRTLSGKFMQKGERYFFKEDGTQVTVDANYQADLRTSIAEKETKLQLKAQSLARFHSLLVQVALADKEPEIELDSLTSSLSNIEAKNLD